MIVGLGEDGRLRHIPGEILLEEFLKPGGIMQMAFAKKLGWTRARLPNQTLLAVYINADMLYQ